MRPTSHEIPPRVDEDAEGEDAVIAELQEELPWAVAFDRTAPVDEFVARLDPRPETRIRHEVPEVFDAVSDRPDSLRSVDADRWGALRLSTVGRRS